MKRLMGILTVFAAGCSTPQCTGGLLYSSIDGYCVCPGGKDPDPIYWCEPPDSAVPDAGIDSSTADGGSPADAAGSFDSTTAIDSGLDSAASDLDSALADSSLDAGDSVHESSDSGADSPDAAPTYQECEQEVSSCIARAYADAGVSTGECRTIYDSCLARVPPPDFSGFTSGPECDQYYSDCLDLGLDPSTCAMHLDQCYAGLPAGA